MRRRELQLGAVERAVLARLWSHGAADVKSMHRAVGAPRGITANTVQSALARLCRKGLAERAKAGRAYRYAPAITRREWIARSLEEILEGLPGAEPELLLSTFVDLAERAGQERLDELERLVRARRSGRIPSGTGRPGGDRDPGGEGGA